MQSTHSLKASSLFQPLNLSSDEKLVSKFCLLSKFNLYRYGAGLTAALAKAEEAAVGRYKLHPFVTRSLNEAPDSNP
jgi:hypothetical protein